MEVPIENGKIFVKKAAGNQITIASLMLSSYTSYVKSESQIR